METLGSHSNKRIEYNSLRLGENGDKISVNQRLFQLFWQSQKEITKKHIIVESRTVDSVTISKIEVCRKKVY